MDLAIRNATIVDGTGSAPRRGDVGVSDGRIVAVTEPGSAELDGATVTVVLTGAEPAARNRPGEPGGEN